MIVPERISTQTPWGELIAEIGGDPTYPEIFVYLKREDGMEIDLNVTSANIEESRITTYVYGDVVQEDFTWAHTWSEKELKIKFAEEV
jgi:hypothetical protein